MTRPLKAVFMLAATALSAALVPLPGHAATPDCDTSRPYKSGEASWYGSRFQGRLTASGERFNMHAMTAAHKTLPLGTVVKVINPENGDEQVVRINDRGPYAGDRIIDLSAAAAKSLGIKEQGTGDVVLRICETAPSLD